MKELTLRNRKFPSDKSQIVLGEITLLYPLSTFDPAALPTEGRKLDLHCGSGKRSLMAAHKLQAAGHVNLTHLAGGLQAWKAAGLPVIRIDPQTGRVVDHGRR